MRLQAGHEGMLIMNGTPSQPTPEQLVIKLKATPLSGGRWQLDLHLAQGLPLQVLVMLAALPEVLRYVAGPLQQMTGGRLDASILRQLLIALAMIGIMLARPRGLWPAREHGKAAPQPVSN